MKFNYKEAEQKFLDIDINYFENNTKVCTICKIEKPLTEFGRDRKDTKTLRAAQCKSCRSKKRLNSKAYKTYRKEQNKVTAQTIREIDKKYQPKGLLSRDPRWDIVLSKIL